MPRKLSDGERMLVDFAEAWEKRFGEQYLIAWGGKDSKWAKTLAATGISWDEYIRRRDIMFGDSKWWELCRCSFAGFVNNLNKFIPQQRSGIQKKVAELSTPIIIDDAGHSVKADQLCIICFPVCSECGAQHRTEETCDEVEERMKSVRSLFGFEDKKRKAGEPTALKDFLKGT